MRTIPLHLRKVARKLHCGHMQAVDRDYKGTIKCQICMSKRLEPVDQALARATFIGNLPSYHARLREHTTGQKVPRKNKRG